MPTIAQAVKEYVESVGSATSEQIKREINSKYPGQWKPAALQAHLYACVVNNPKAYIYHPYADRFLYKTSDGMFEIYNEKLHGPNEWIPQPGEDDEKDVAVAELAETTISLERDIEDHLVKDLSSIEEGLKLVQRQMTTEVGRFDIMAEDKEGLAVVIEIKVGEAKDSSIGQIARYLGWYSKSTGKPVRGILVANDFPLGVVYAAAAIPNLRLMSYKVNFTFQEATV